jgi:hypothetical protein
MTTLLAVVIAVNPIGWELTHGGFYAGESITRDIPQILLSILGAMTATAVIAEWLLWWWLARHRDA